MPRSRRRQPSTRSRSSDGRPRPRRHRSAELAECPRIASRLVSRSPGRTALTVPLRRLCSRSGAAAWKRAMALPRRRRRIAYCHEEGAKRTCVPAGATGLDRRVDSNPVLLEVERVAELLNSHGIVLPRDLTYARRAAVTSTQPPSRTAPLKVQVDATACVDPGRLSRRPSGAARVEADYRFSDGRPALVDAARRRTSTLSRWATGTKAETRRRFAEGEPIPRATATSRSSGSRSTCSATAEARRAFERLLEAERSSAAAARREARPQAVPRRGASGREHPTEQERSSAKARRVLDERRAGTARAMPVPGKSRAAPRCSFRSPTSSPGRRAGCGAGRSPRAP